MKSPIPHNYREANCGLFSADTDSPPGEIIPVDPGLHAVLQAYRQAANDLHDTRAYALHLEEYCDDFQTLLDNSEGHLREEAEHRNELETALGKERAKCANLENDLEKIRKHRDDLAEKISSSRKILTEFKEKFTESAVVPDMNQFVLAFERAINDTKA